MPPINEETLKQRYIIPYVQSLGFDANELSFEESFSIRVGRQEHRVSSTTRGRLDILVTRSGKNLFVLEAKGEAEPVTQDEIDQAISYARLVHPVAPFAVVMSGHAARIFDAISKKEMTGEVLRDAEGMRVELPAEEYQSALRYFVGYSRENLITFCRKQVLERTESIRSTTEHPNRKYVRELYEPNPDLTQAFERFLSGLDHLFVVVAPSGLGKSSWLCNTALNMIENSQPALFYAARELRESVIDTIASDLNWGLTPTIDSVTAAKKTFDYLSGDGLYIFVDGLDYLPPSKARRFLSDFMRVIRGRNVRLVCACKDTAWPLLLTDDGDPTLIQDSAFKDGRRPGVHIDTVPDRQFYKLIQRYREFFGFNGGISSRLLEEARQNLFLLRMAFEIARENGLGFISYDTADIVRGYFESQVSRLDNRGHVLLMLKKLGRLMVDGDRSVVGLEECLNPQSFPSDPELIHSLVRVGLLQITIEDADQNVSFAFDTIRDFIICRDVLGLHKEAPAKIDQLFGGKLSPLKRDLLNAWYTLAPSEHKKYLEGTLREKAERYTLFYEEFLRKHFPNLSASFRPHTSGPIGFVGYLDLPRKRIAWHGFRKIDAMQERVLFLPFISDDDLAFALGVSHFHSSSATKDFRDIEFARAVLEGEVVPELNRIIKRGMLDESHNVVLLEEKLLALACAHLRQDLQLNFKLSPIPCLPLQLHVVRKALVFRRAAEIVGQRIVKERLFRGEIKEQWHTGGVVSYSFEHTPDDIKRIQAEAARAAESNVLLEYDRPNINSAESEMLDALQHLQARGVNAITSSLVPEPNGRGGWVHSLWAGDVRRKLIRDLYESFVNEYQVLVDRNFPMLANHMWLRSKLPAKFYILLSDGGEIEGVFDTASARIFGVSVPQQAKNEVELIDPQQFRYDHRGRTIIYKGVEQEPFLAGGFSLDALLSPSETYVQARVNRLHCAIRSLVYKQIKDELPGALSVLAAEYGFEFKANGFH